MPDLDAFNLRDALALLFRLRLGGHIVSTSALTAEEIAAARAAGRMWVDGDGFGYVWLDATPKAPR